MNHQPQPPELRRLHDVTDPASVIHEAGVPYGDENAERLTKATRDFLQALAEHQIPHLLVGGMAMLQHIDGRPTRDIDLILATRDMERLPGFHLEERNEWFATGSVGAVRIDLRFTANPLFRDVLERHAQSKILLGIPIRCATPVGLILLKLFALPSLYRHGEIRRAAVYETDVLHLLTLQPIEPGPLLAQLQPHLIDSDLNALGQILHEIRSRLQTAKKFRPAHS